MVSGKKYHVIGLLIILCMTGSCLNSDNNCVEETYSSPKAFNFILVDGDGKNLINDDGYNMDSIDLYYYSNLGSTRVNITFLGIADGYILISSELPRTVIETSNQTYFLYLNHQDTDTLFVNVLRESDECSTWHRYEDCMYNGIVMDIDPASYTFVGVK